MTSARGAVRAEAPAVLRIAPAPSAEPPPEGQAWRRTRSWDGAGPGATAYVQGALAVDLRDDASDSFFGPQATGTADLPEAGAWARRMIRAMLEVCAGTRSADQIVRWTAPDVRERIARRGALARRRRRRPHTAPLVRALLTCEPADGICEASAVVQADGRVRALAVRMSGVDGRWLITAFELG